MDSATLRAHQLNGDICHLSPILLTSSLKEMSLQHFHTMEGGTPQVVTGVFKLTYTRGHSTRLLGQRRMWLKFHFTTWTSLGRRKQKQQHSWRTTWKKPKGFSCHPWRKLSTTIPEIQACLNSRPLCDLSIGSFQPNTFVSRTLHWCITDPVTCADYTNVTCNSLSSWQTYPQQLQQFRQTWSSDHPQSAATSTMQKLYCDTTYSKCASKVFKCFNIINPCYACEPALHLWTTSFIAFMYPDLPEAGIQPSWTSGQDKVLRNNYR